jgi:hypothetical protein
MDLSRASSLALLVLDDERRQRRGDVGFLLSNSKRYVANDLRNLFTESSLSLGKMSISWLGGAQATMVKVESTWLKCP